MHLFSIRSQMTWKCGKNKKVACKPLAKCATDVLTAFWSLQWSTTETMRSNMESINFVLFICTIKKWIVNRDIICVCPQIDHRKQQIEKHVELAYFIKLFSFVVFETKEFLSYHRVLVKPTAEDLQMEILQGSGTW